MNRFAASLTALLITVSSQGLAEPSDDIQTLMDEKLSMLDWGMYRIEQKLNQIEALTLFQKVKIYTTYDQSRDKIIIGLFDRFTIPTYAHQAEYTCEKNFAAIDEELNVELGRDVFDGKCVVCNFFSRNGWSQTQLTQPSQSLRDKFTLQGYFKGYTCDRDLYGTSISVSKN